MYAPTAYATLSLTIAQYADHAADAATEAAEYAAQHPSDPYLATKAAAAASCHALAARTTRRYYARQWANDAKRMAREAYAHAATLNPLNPNERSKTMNHTDLSAASADRAAQTIERVERDLPNARRALLADLDEVESLLATAQEALENADPERAEDLAQDALDALNELAH